MRVRITETEPAELRSACAERRVKRALAKELRQSSEARMRKAMTGAPRRHETCGRVRTARAQCGARRALAKTSAARPELPGSAHAQSGAKRALA